MAAGAGSDERDGDDNGAADRVDRIVRIGPGDGVAGGGMPVSGARCPASTREPAGNRLSLHVDAGPAGGLSTATTGASAEQANCTGGTVVDGPAPVVDADCAHGRIRLDQMVRLQTSNRRVQVRSRGP